MDAVIPHGGLGTELANFIKEYHASSPSHAVGSEHVFEDGGLALVLREGSPSHAVGLVGSELRPEPAYSPEEYVSPSHTVGLERKECKLVVFQEKESPSHTVGLEQLHASRGGKHQLWSPSHTVGLEPAKGIPQDNRRTTSPSHTVGLEHWQHPIHS